MLNMIEDTHISKHIPIPNNKIIKFCPTLNLIILYQLQQAQILAYLQVRLYSLLNPVPQRHSNLGRQKRYRSECLLIS